MTLRAQNPAQITIIRSQYLRLPMRADIQRVAVGDSEILSAEPINNRELLLLGKSSGRTTLLVWFHDGSVQQYLCSVHRDLSLLQTALKRVHPSIEAEIAPDRDAIVLTGLVPDITYFRAAELAANNYLNATQAGAGRLLIQTNQPGAQPPAGQPGAPAPVAQPGQQPASPATSPADLIRLPATLPPTGTVINLIGIENLPPLSEQKIADAIRNIGGSAVTVRRLIRGQVRDDGQDIFVLEGRVPNQVALTRILTIASQIVTGQAAGAQQDIRVLADEAGALASGIGGAQGGAGGTGAGGGGGGLGTTSIAGLGGGGGGNLFNQVRRNLGRAKAIEAAGGRILSILEVADLPQVRVNIRLFEVNRSKLRSFSSNFSGVIGSTHVGSFTPTTNSPVPRVGPAAAIENILGFLGGTLTNETAVTAGKFALDSVLSYLEQQGIARSLSSPSLTVLSGEQAQFQVGGDIPIPQSVATPIAGANGVFNSVVFLNFGVELNIRPLVGDDDMLTLDVAPQVSTPDTGLTTSIRQNTGTPQTTTAFQTRSLRTSARLQDGQALLIGGLLSRNTNDTQSSTPGLRDVPGLGWLFKNLNRTDDGLELVIVVNPVIVRDPSPGVRLWEFPTSSELMQSFGKGAFEAPPGGEKSLPVQP